MRIPQKIVRYYSNQCLDLIHGIQPQLIKQYLISQSILITILLALKLVCQKHIS